MDKRVPCFHKAFHNRDRLQLCLKRAQTKPLTIYKERPLVSSKKKEKIQDKRLKMYGLLEAGVFVKRKQSKKTDQQSGQRLFLLTEIRIHFLITKFEKMFASQVKSLF